RKLLNVYSPGVPVILVVASRFLTGMISLESGSGPMVSSSLHDTARNADKAIILNRLKRLWACIFLIIIVSMLFMSFSYPVVNIIGVKLLRKKCVRADRTGLPDA